MWQELIDVLEEIQQGYQSMLELSRKKRAVLVAVDMKGLEQVVDLEEKVLSRIHKAEQHRQDVLRKLAAAEPEIQPDTKMAEVFGRAPSFAMADRLRKLHESLSKLIAEVQEAGDNNQVLINKWRSECCKLSAESAWWIGGRAGVWRQGPGNGFPQQKF